MSEAMTFQNSAWHLVTDSHGAGLILSDAEKSALVDYSIQNFDEFNRQQTARILYIGMRGEFSVKQMEKIRTTANFTKFEDFKPANKEGKPVPFTGPWAKQYGFQCGMKLTYKISTAGDFVRFIQLVSYGKAVFKDSEEIMSKLDGITFTTRDGEELKKKPVMLELQYQVKHFGTFDPEGTFVAFHKIVAKNIDQYNSSDDAFTFCQTYLPVVNQCLNTELPKLKEAKKE